jgi:hypothetical protein
MRRALILAGLLLIPGFVFAQTLSIRPALVDSSSQVEDALKRNAGHASTVLTGNGHSLFLTYSTSEPIEVFMVPLAADNNFFPTDFVTFTLPEAEEGAANIDLTVSPGWAPGEQRYLLNLLTKSENANASFVSADFEPASLFDTVKAAFGHLFTPEPFTPSSYHALRGYRVLGYSVAVVLGMLTILVALTIYFISKPAVRLRNASLVLFAAMMLYALRWSVDLVRFTHQHLTEYANHTYDEAGSIYSVADTLKNGVASNNQKLITNNSVVFVCRDGTNFKEKVLRYFAYPTKITSEAADASGATLAIVMDKFDWKFTENSLSCGPIKRAAEKVVEFDDGSVLFRLK